MQRAHVYGACKHASATSDQQGAGGIGPKALETRSSLDATVVCSHALYGAWIAVAWRFERPHCTRS